MVSASAVRVTLANQSRLSISLTVYPAPCGPTCRIRSGSPMASSSGRDRRWSSVAPPTKICSVPAPAPVIPPATGASRTGWPGPAAARTLSATAGTLVDMSIQVAPAASPASRPPGPSRTSSTWVGPGSMVMTTSRSAPASPGDPTQEAPAASRPAAASGRTSWTTSSWPAARTLLLIGAPMWPRPMKPTFMISPGRRGGMIPVTEMSGMSGRPSRQSPAVHRGFVNSHAEPGLPGHGDVPGGVDEQRLGQEEIAPALGPAGRVVGELEVGAAAGAGRHVQVGQQAEPVGPGVRGEPAVPQLGELGDGPRPEQADGQDGIGLHDVERARGNGVQQLGRGAGHLTARDADPGLLPEQAHAGQVTGGPQFFQPS